MDYLSDLKYQTMAFDIWAKETETALYLSSSLLYRNMFFLHRKKNEFFSLTIIFKLEGKDICDELADTVFELSSGRSAFCVCKDWREATSMISHYLSGDWEEKEWQQYERLYEKE
jgi:hypothetical protein